MAFVTKKDYCGLARTGVLDVAGDTQGATSSDVTATDDLGDVVAVTVVSGGEAPTNDYDLKADCAFTGTNAIKIGTVKTVGTAKYMLTGVSINLAAGALPTISASASDVESSADGSTVVVVPDFTVSKIHKAALLFDEATVGGTGCNVIACSYTIGGNAQIDRDEMGAPIASGVNGYSISNSVTIQQTGSAVPTVTPEEGWHAGALTQVNPKAQYPTWSVTLTKYLTTTEA